MFIRDPENTDHSKTLGQRNSQKPPRLPTQEEIDILFSSLVDLYVAEGFDPSKGDANTKWDGKLGHKKNTKILVLKKKIFGNGYEPYKPSQHGTNPDVFKPITVNNYRATRSAACTEYDRLTKNNNTAANPNIAPILPVTQNPTKEEIDLITSKNIDAYIAEGFDPSKGDDNEKYDLPKHGNKAKILVLHKKYFGGGYEPYKPSQHGESAYKFKTITVSSYRSARSEARKAFKEWLMKNDITDSNVDTSRLLPQIPTQREIDILFSPKIDAYVTEGFDPSKGDANGKYDTQKHFADTKILILKKKIFGGGYEPYNPSQHDENSDQFKSVTVNAYTIARFRARKAYEQWMDNNTISPFTTTSVPNTTSTTTTTTNQVGAKRFNPIHLINNYESKSEMKEQETDNRVAAPQTVRTTQQRKRTVDGGSLVSIPSFTRNSFALFQEMVEPAVSKDPTEPKRLRLND